MKKLIILLILILPTVAMGQYVYGPQNGGGGSSSQRVTMAELLALPTPPADLSATYTVTDAVDATDCSVGSGTALSDCRWNENTVGWAAIGAAAAGTGTVDSIVGDTGSPTSGANLTIEGESGVLNTSTSGDTLTINITAGGIGAPQIGVDGVGSSELAATGVTANSYTNPNLTIDEDGRITDASNGSGSGAPTDATYWVGASDGTLSAEIVVDDLAALNTALGGTSIADGAHTTDTNANTVCSGTDTYMDGEGNCDDISSVYAASSHSHDTSDITTGTLAYEQGGLEADISSYTGLIGIAGGATVEVDTIAELDTALGTTGTPTASTFLRGDNAWAVPGGSGDVPGVGDCINGDCLDGTSDGGTEITLYNASGNATLANVAGVFDMDVAVTATSFTADDANPTLSNIFTLYDNEGTAGDFTCAVDGVAGILSILDKSGNTAGDLWAICDGTTELFELSDVALIDGNTYSGTHNFGGATVEVPNGTTLPASCTVGELYMDTDATTGQRFYLCESTDTWALQGDGGDTDTDTTCSDAACTVGTDDTITLEGGTTVTALADDEVFVGTGAAAGSFTALPNCTSGTESLNWNGTTFECDTITGGSASNSYETWDFTTSASGTDTTASGTTDTIKWIEGTGVTITGADGSPDSVTVATNFDDTGSIEITNTSGVQTFDMTTCDIVVDFDQESDDAQAFQDALNTWLDESTAEGSSDNDAYVVCATGDIFADFDDTTAIPVDTDGTGDPTDGPMNVFWTISPTDNGTGACGIWNGVTVDSAANISGYPISCDMTRSNVTSRPLHVHFDNVTVEWDRSVAQTAPVTFFHIGDYYFSGNANYDDIIISGSLTIALTSEDTTTTVLSPFNITDAGFRSPIDTADNDWFVGGWCDGAARSNMSNFNFTVYNATTSTHDDYRTVGWFSEYCFGIQTPAMDFTGLGVGISVIAPSRMSDPWRGNIRDNNLNIQIGVPDDGCEPRVWTSNAGSTADSPASTGCSGHRFQTTYEGGQTAIALYGNFSTPVIIQDSHHEQSTAAPWYHSHILGAGVNSITGQICISDTEADTQSSGATCDHATAWGTGTIVFSGGNIGGDTEQTTDNYDTIIYGEGASYGLTLSNSVEVGRSDDDATNGVRTSGEAGLIFNTAESSNANSSAVVNIDSMNVDYAMSKIPTSFAGEVRFSNTTFYKNDCTGLGFRGDSRIGDRCIDNLTTNIGKVYECRNTGSPAHIGCNGDADWVEMADTSDIVTLTYEECFPIYAPSAEIQDTDDIKSVWRAPAAVTITEVWCETDTGTVDMDLQIDDGTPADVMGADLTCASTAVSDSSSLTGSMADGNTLDFAITSVASNPTRLTACIEYTYD